MLLFLSKSCYLNDIVLLCHSVLKVGCLANVYYVINRVMCSDEFYRETLVKVNPKYGRVEMYS